MPRRLARTLEEGADSIRDMMWRQQFATLGGKLSEAVQHYRDYEFAEQYLKDTTLFQSDTAARWFPPADFHHTNSDLVDQFSRVVIRRFRESAKSTQFTIIRPIRLICEDRNIRIVVISKKEDIAARFVATVAQQLDTNRKLLEAFGPFRSKDASWTPHSFFVTRTAAHKEPTMQAVGRGGQIVSGRYELVILDDVEDYESTKTDHSRQSTYEWFSRDVIPVVAPGGKLLVIQTPQHEMDLVGQTLKSGRIWEMITVPAEIEVVQDGRTKRVPTWPEKFPIYWQSLMWGKPCAVERAELRGQGWDTMARVAGTACRECPVHNLKFGNPEGVGCLTGKRLVEMAEAFYKLQYLCSLEALGGTVFKRDWFRYYRRSEIEWREGRWWYNGPGQVRPYRMRVRIGIDPAIADEKDKQPEAHSKFALVVRGFVKELRRSLVLHFVNDRLSWPEQLDVALGDILAWSPEEIVVEKIGYQRALKQALAKHHFPVRGVDQDTDKFRRFSILSPDFRAGNVYVLEEQTPQGEWQCAQEELVSQFTTYTSRAVFTDIMDAYELSGRGLEEGAAMFEDLARREKTPEDSEHVVPSTVPKEEEKLWTVEEVLSGRPRHGGLQW